MTTFPSASAPSIFSFDSKSIRAITDEQGASWFVLRDLLGAMDSTTKVTDAVASIEEGLGKGFVNDVPLLTSGGMQTLTIGAEPAATYLLSRSNTETGRRLNRFIHVEVLPSIRKTGRYEATAAQPSIQAHFQGSRWLVHVDSRGNLIFNPVDCEAFHVPAREFPAVIGSEEFPSRLLPEVLSAVSERMRRTGGLLQGDVRSEPRPPVLSAAQRISVLPETNRPAQPQASRSRRPVTQRRTTPLPARREYPPPFESKKDFVELMLEMVQERKAKDLAAKLRIDSRWCHQVIVYVEGKSRVTTAEVVAELHEEGTDQNKRRAGRILKALGFFGRRAYQGGKSFRVYVRGGQS